MSDWRARSAKRASLISLVGFFGGATACAPAARPIEASTPPGQSATNEPTETRSESASPPPPAPLEQHGEERSARKLTTENTASGSHSLCLGERSDLLLPRLAVEFGGAMSGGSFTWLAHATEAQLTERLGPGRAFECGPLAYCFEPARVPTADALAALPRVFTPSSPADVRPRPATWRERYELVASAMARADDQGPRAAPSSSDAEWQQALRGTLPGFSVVVAQGMKRSHLVLVMPAGSTHSEANDVGEVTAPRAERERARDGQPAGTRAPGGRMGLVRAVTESDGERALLVFAPRGAEERAALARGVRALALLAAPGEARIVETSGGLLLLELTGEVRVLTRALAPIGETFMRLTSAVGAIDDATFARARGVEPPALDRACDAELGGAHTSPTPTQALDALRRAGLLLVLEAHLPKPSSKPRASGAVAQTSAAGRQASGAEPQASGAEPQAELDAGADAPELAPPSLDDLRRALREAGLVARVVTVGSGGQLDLSAEH